MNERQTTSLLRFWSNHFWNVSYNSNDNDCSSSHVVHNDDVFFQYLANSKVCCIHQQKDITVGNQKTVNDNVQSCNSGIIFHDSNTFFSVHSCTENDCYNDEQYDDKRFETYVSDHSFISNNDWRLVSMWWNDLPPSLKYHSRSHSCYSHRRDDVRWNVD